MRGWIRSFHNDRGYGFIEGDDGQDHFFHIDDLNGHEPPVFRQEVSFRPDMTAKGPRARSVTLSSRPQRAQQIYLNPDHFIMTRDTEIHGHVIVRVVGHNFWGESNDSNATREILKQQGAKPRRQCDHRSHITEVHQGTGLLELPVYDTPLLRERGDRQED